MPKKRGTRSGLRREFREVRSTAFRKLRGLTNDLSEYELQISEQQIIADLDRFDVKVTANASSHTTGTTANECHDGHGQAARAGTSTTRSTAGRSLDGTQDDGIKVESEPIRAAGPEDPPQSATLDKKYRELLARIDDNTKEVHNVDLDPEDEEMSMQLYFALVVEMPRESVGELIVRNVHQGEGAAAWRQLLGEYASTEPGNVLAM